MIEDRIDPIISVIVIPCTRMMPPSEDHFIITVICGGQLALTDQLIIFIIQQKDSISYGKVIDTSGSQSDSSALHKHSRPNIQKK